MGTFIPNNIRSPVSYRAHDGITLLIRTRFFFKMADHKGRRIGIRILKIFGWIVLSIVGLLILIAISIQIPWVQDKIKQKAIAFLEDKIHTKVELEHFSLAFPKKIVLTGFYMEDQQKDTLIYAGRLGIDTDLWALTDHTIELKTIQLEDFTTTIKRSERDSAFNFDYIIKAFVTDTVQADTSAAAPWNFALGDVRLSNIRLHLDDSLSGNHVNLRLGELDINTDEFDLTNSRVAFDDINISNVTAEVVQSKLPLAVPDSSEVIPEDSSKVVFDVDFKEFNIENINAMYHQSATGQMVNISLPEGRIESNDIDMKNQIIDLVSIEFSRSYISLEQMPVKKNPEVAVTPTQNEDAAQPPWQLMLSAFDLSGITLQFNNYNEPAQPGTMDFNHLWISNLSTAVRNVRYTGDEISAIVSKFAFQEKSGFRVNAFRTALLVQPDSMGLENFYLRTGNSLLKLDGKAKYASIEKLAENFDDALFSFNIRPSSLSVKDLLYFTPHVLDSAGVALSPSSVVRMDAYAHGTLHDLTITRLQVHALGNTSLFASGKVKEVMQPEQLVYDVYIDRLHTTRQDIKSLLPATLIPPSIELPQWISLKGNYKGTLKTPDTKTILTSDFGRIDLRAKLDLNKDSKENYQGEMVIQDFNIGQLLKQPQQMGRLDMVAAVNGAGLTIDDLDASFKVRVNRFNYSGYTYRDFRLDGSMQKYFFNGKASIRDENLNFVLTGDMDYNEDVPHYKFELDLKNADLKKLKLTPREMKTKAQLVVDLETPDFKSLNGHLDIRKFAIFNGQDLYSVDSLLFASIDQEGQSEISIKSDILSGDFKGTINIFSLPDLLSRHFNRYFSLRDTVYAKPVENQNFKFNMVIKNTDLITEILVPELEPFVPGKITGEFNSAEHKLNVNISLAEINYSGIAMDTISLKVLSNPESFDFTISLKEILVDTLNIKALRLAGNVMHDSIRTNLMILDSLEKEKYFLGGVFNSFEDAFQFRFLKNHLILNYEEWDTPLYNALRFTDRGLDPNNFLIRNGEARILLLRKNNADSTLSLLFNDVDLKNITSLVEGTTPVGGMIDGELNLGSSKTGTFETELAIKNLELLEQPWGNLVFLMKKSRTTPMNLKLDLTGNDAELHAEGSMGSDENPDIQIRATLEKLNLSIVEPLTMGQLKKLTGNLTGEITVQGKTKDPDISGRVNFSNTNFISTFTNTAFSIENESVYLREEDIVFDQFEIMDNKKNKAILDGVVSSNPKGGFDLGLNLTADNFQLFNTTAKDNELFYGKVWLNTKATVTGNSFQPIIKMNVSLSKGSEVTYVVPQSEKGVMEQKGIVVFVDKDAVNDPFMKSINPEDTVKAGFTGMDLTANIELSDEEKFNVVIDPVTGDRLSVRGNSTLTLHMDPTGDMQLTGRYEITEGSYDLSFAKFVKRNFTIDKGSTIVWTGDPMNGQMDIRAIYAVETSPVDLVANQVSEEELNQYKKEVPFQVYLILKGELLFPDIHFRLDMPEDARNEFGGNIYAKLQDINQQESDLNKQVFALLILKRFISDNPFESEAGGDLASSARKSVSKLLSEQLNKLSSNVKGVELSFDLKSYEDASKGGKAQTDLELGVSKSLMNDRLVVKVSGNVNLEGEQNEQNSITDYVGDLALEYKLTEDGRFRITGFRNSNYDIIDGDLIETGAGLIYIKDYDTLKELFKPNNADKKKK
jgi:translocation and assembly module TamB